MKKIIMKERRYKTGRSKTPQLSETEKQEIKDMSLAGLSPYVMAKKYNRSPS
jgi:hypothetical protein